MEGNYSLEECNTKGFKGSIDDYITCIKSNDIPSIEGNNDKPGIYGTTFKAIFDKEDLTPYFDTKLIEELYDYSRNFVKAKTEELFKLKVRYNEALLENEKEKIHHARAINFIGVDKVTTNARSIKFKRIRNGRNNN